MKNAAWIIGCKIIQSILNLVIGMMTARYLGPSNYGVITYVSSIVAFAVPIMQLGMKQTLVKEVVQSSEREGEILGTSLVMNIISSIFCMLGCVSFVAIADAGDKETIIICALYSLTLLFQATEITQYWFQAKLLSKYPSIASLFAYIVVAAYKVFLLATQKSIAWFALSNVLDYFLISVILIVFYRKLGNQKLKFSWCTGKKCFHKASTISYRVLWL